MEEGRGNKYRNTYIVLIAAGVYLLAQKVLGVSTVLSVFLIALGVYAIRNEAAKKGYVCLIVGLLILIGSNFTILVAVALLSLGFFIIKSKKVHRDGDYIQKQRLVESVKWDKEPWVLRNMSIWSLVGEINMDLSLAIVEGKDVTVILQGIVGDVDIIVPAGMAVAVEGTVFFGQMDVLQERETGLLNRVFWQSPSYATGETRVKLIVSYIVGDVDVKVI